MKTWEVYKIALENPKVIVIRKSDSRKFEFDKFGRFEPVKSVVSYVCSSPSDEWELVPEPVDFMDAMKALREQEIISVELDGFAHTFGSLLLKDRDDHPITIREIIDGKWYINCEGVE